jgi:hypothetical protein
MKTQFYRACNGKRWVQLSTKGANGWLTTNGPARDLKQLTEQHAELVKFAQK